MKTKGMGIALLSAAALLGSAAANAELDWTYGEVAFNKADGTDDFETDAFDLKASIGFLDMWHASLLYIDGDAGDTDFDGYRAVVGAHPQLGPNTQLVTDLTYFDYELDGSEGGADGFGVGFGLRHALTDKFELGGQIWYVDGDLDDGFSDESYNDTTFEFGGRYNWTSNFSTGLTVYLDGYPGLGSGFGSSSSFGDTIRLDARLLLGQLLSK